MRLRVLLAVPDLFHKIGGGETVYRKIIDASPGIDFFYFRIDKSAHAPRPEYATALPMRMRQRLELLVPPPFPDYKRRALEHADAIACSVAGMSFDIVDVPDFEVYGSLLRDAFRHHGVEVGRIVLALHGNISTSNEMQWGSTGDKVLEQRILEFEQFERSDAVYGLSPRYIKEWQTRVDRRVHYIDPLCFVDLPDSSELYGKIAPVATSKPPLYCIGRTERRKGNDLFIELARWIKPGLFSEGAHIGSNVIASHGIDSRYILGNIAKLRGIPVPFLGSMSRQALRHLYASRAVIVLPVRYDTLNLVALDALFCGCPVAVSNKAGVCDYLDENFPALPYVKIDFNNFYACVPAIERILTGYDAYSRELVSRVTAVLPGIKARLDMEGVYRSALAEPRRDAGRPYPEIRYKAARNSIRRLAATTVRKVLPIKGWRQMQAAVVRQLMRVKMVWNEQLTRGYGSAVRVVFDMIDIGRRMNRIAQSPEYSTMRLRQKLGDIYYNIVSPLYRCNFWADIARIERVLGHDLIAVAYELRLLRLLGQDVFGALPNVVSTLNAHGFKHEAEAAFALYEDPAKASERALAFLRAAEQRNLTKPKLPYEVLEDRRRGRPKVSVIVSLYKAAPKLVFFLQALLCQSLIADDAEAVEIILIDSGSPLNEGEVVTEFWGRMPLNAVYARSAARETIQAAWNRGIQLARAPYLAFLGVDETLYPDALAKLAGALDDNGAVDWVMGSSLVTDVDEHGVYKNDVMTYDRKDAVQDLCYLESCYVAYVGGMYRRSVHDRYGYYDESFRGAGDTEFKNRVLPHIKVKFLPETLGLFLNYPEERTTASPMAEIEDLRAWYIHRSPGGVRYAFDARPVDDAYTLLQMAAGYRKSYCRHISTDIEYAKYLADYLVDRGFAGASARVLAGDFGDMLEVLRSLEFAPVAPSAKQCFDLACAFWGRFRRFQCKHRALLQRAKPVYRGFNDNRYEQHSWLWKSQ